MFSLHYFFLSGNFIIIPYDCTGYELYTYACMRVYVHVAIHAQGTDIFEGVIHPDIFEGVFQMDTVKGVHICACMYMVHSHKIFNNPKHFLQPTFT